MRFSCSEFNVYNNGKNCRGKDKLTIRTNGKKKAYCKRKGPDVTTTARYLTVSFVSGRRKQSSGTVCRMECVAATTLAPMGNLTPTQKFCSDDLIVELGKYEDQDLSGYLCSNGMPTPLTCTGKDCHPACGGCAKFFTDISGADNCNSGGE